MAERWLYAWGLGSVGFGGASLLIPLYVVQLGGTAVDLGLLAASATAVGAPGAIVFGRMADRVGHRRTLVLVTLGVVTIALALVPFLTDVTAVILTNAGLWLVVASVSPVLTMLVVADAPEGQWSHLIGQLNKYQGYGWASGLVLGAVWPLLTRGILESSDALRSLFWLLSLCAGLAALLSVRSLPRPRLDDGTLDRRRIRRVGRLLATTSGRVKGVTFAFSPNRLYWTTRGIEPRRFMQRLGPTMATYLAGASLFFAGFAAFWAPLPLFFTSSGFNPGQIFALYLVSSIASAISYERAGKLASEYDVRLLQSGALLLRGLLFPVIAFVGAITLLSLSLIASGLVLVLIGLTWAIIAVVGTAIVTRLAPPGVRGEMLGVHTALAAVAGGTGGLLGGWVATMDYLLMFAVSGGLVIAGAVLVATLHVLSVDDGGG